MSIVFHTDEFQKRGFELGAIEYLTKPIDDNKLLNKIRLFKRLIESEKSLRQQKEYMQAIIDLQNQILLVIDKKNIERANKRFFDFFGYVNLEVFTKEHRCIGEFFVEKVGFLPPSITENDKEWLNIVTTNPEEMHLAIVRHKQADVIMAVDATLLRLFARINLPPVLCFGKRQAGYVLVKYFLQIALTLKTIFIS